MIYALPLCAALSALFLPQDDAAAPDPEPTVEETLALELVNRFRADPAAEAERLAALPSPIENPALDLEMFRREMAALEPAPPLVWDPRLSLAAQNHARYVLAHREYGHGETHGRAGFSGAMPVERAHFAGYASTDGDARECTWGQARDVLDDHRGYLVDEHPDGPGGMLASRGHRLIHAHPSMREFGMGFLPDGRRHVSVRLFAPGGDRRMAGGVCILDLDGDGFYDPGEGLGGVRVAVVGGPEARSWSSGAWTLELGGAQSGVLRAELHDVAVETRFPAGGDNVKLDAELAAPIAARAADLRTELERGTATRRKRAAVDLWVWSRTAPAVVAVDDLEPALAAGRRLEAERGRVRDGLAGDDPDAAARLAAELARDWRGTLAEPWLEQAAALARIRAGRAAVESATGRSRAKRRARLLQELTDLARRVRDEDLRALLDAERRLLED